MHGVFEQRAREAPGATAVVCHGQELTYGELDALAGELAGELAGLGVRREDRVAVHASPSLELVVAMLGVLKAGGAYVPLDPEHPGPRREFLLDDSGAQVVLTQRHVADSVPGAGCHVVVLDPPSGREPGRRPSRATAPPPPPGGVAADGLACVIYTSGSTGVPKGVAVTHRGITNLASAAARQFGLRRTDRFMQLASVTFSAILEEIYPALLHGATVVLEGYGKGLRSVGHFLRRLDEERITAFEITTPYWHALVDELVASGRRLPACVRLVVMGGERSLEDRVAAWTRFGIPLVHVYGPTEATATATYHDLAPGTGSWTGELPIGRAIPGATVRVVDGAMQPVPPGSAGELVVGGDCLARGYLGRPATTAERFVPDPAGPPGARLYRTGDLARWRPDGALEFLGRADDQIKVRGIRVEPREIETALEGHPAVAQAVVTLRQVSPTDRQLVAYLVFEPGQDVDAAALRAHLGRLLPSALVPGTFVPLDRLPLTPHGKLDRGALPAPEQPAAAPAGPAGPVSETEARVAAIWAEVLGLTAVGPDDDFFALGGDSLHVVRILARVERTLGVELTPHDVLSGPTVRTMAWTVDRARAATAPAAGPPRPAATAASPLEPYKARRRLIERTLAGGGGGRTRAVPISVSQQGLWVMAELLGEHPLYNEAWQCVLRGPLDVACFRRAFAAVVERHEILRTRFTKLGGTPVQVVGGEVSRPDVVYVDATAPRRRLRAVPDAGGEASPGGRRFASLPAAEHLREPFDLERGPLVRARLVRLGPDEHVLEFNAHHLVFDGWSVEVLVAELGQLYGALAAGRPSPLAPLPAQYGEFALWQRDRLDGSALERLLAYWREQLADAPPPPSLGDAGPGGPSRSFPGARVGTSLSPPLRSAVVGLARERGATPFMVLLAAFATLLHRTTGHDDLCIGSPLANRTLPETEGLVGCFLNTVVLRVRTGGDPTFADLLARVREVCTGAFAHQELPFARLVEELRPARQPGRNPFFEVAFASDNEEGLRREAGGLAFDDFETLSTGTSKFEMSWIATDTGDDLRLTVEYRTDLFAAAAVQAMVDDYTGVLWSVVRDPDRPVAAPARRAGPAAAAGQDHAPGDAPGPAAAGAVQAWLHAQWCEAFERDEVGVDEDFFALGGYSMLAVRLLTRAQDEFGVELALSDFFDRPTIADLAEQIGAAEPAAPARPSVPVAGEDLEEILAAVEQLSETEVARRLEAADGNRGLG